MRILLLAGSEPDFQIDELLRLAGHSVDVVSVDAAALNLLKAVSWQALIVTGLSGADACTLVGLVRQTGNDTPLVVLGSDTHVADRVDALRAGADDFVCVPYHGEEVISRVQAVIRRSQHRTRAKLCCGPLSLDQASQEASVGATNLTLSPKEYAVLEFMAQRPGSTLTKATMLTQLYGPIDRPTDKIIDFFICKLRKKLELAGAGGLIETVWGYGYRLGQPTDGGTSETESSTYTAELSYAA